MSTTQKCRLGFIGCGRLMNRQHLPNAHRSDICVIHTLCDLDAGKLRTTAEKYSPEKTTTDYRQLLADPEIDAVVIAMDPRGQCRFTMEALEAGKHVYVEKPLGEKVSDAVAVERKARQMGRRVAVGLNRRFAPPYRDIRPHLLVRRQSCLLYYRVADPYGGSEDRLHMEICHVFDTLRWLMGCEVTEVFAARGGYPHDAMVMLKFQDNSIATIGSSSQASTLVPKEHLEAMWDDKAVTIEDFVEARFFGIEGLPALKRYRGHPFADYSNDYVERFATEGLDALIDERTRAYEAHKLKDAGGHPPRELIDRPFHYIVEKGWPMAMDGFARAIMDGKQPENASAIDAAWATRLAESANESIVSGKLIKPVPPESEL